MVFDIFTIPKKNREILNDNSSLFDQNLLNQLLYYTNIKAIAFSWLKLWKR